MAKKSAEVTECEIAGVDLFYDATTKSPMVCDVNAAPGWKGTAGVLKEDIARAMIEFVAGVEA